MSKKNTANEPASWGLRLSALALSLLSVVVIFAFRFAYNGKEIQAVMWACSPLLVAVAACVLLGRIKKLSSSLRKWQIYTYVLLLTSLAVLLKTWL